MSKNSICTPTDDSQASSLEQFKVVVSDLVTIFPENNLCRKLDAGRMTMTDYHSFLNMIFHQTFEAPSLFALAGAHCGPQRFGVRDYLIAHAEEEKSHWEWVIEDLRSTGFDGPDPRTRFPHPACQRFVAFNLYSSIRMPVARLATAAFLEGVGGVHGKKYAIRLCTTLALKSHQAKFLYGHGDTDVGHTDDILRVLSEASLSPYEWAWMEHAARTAADNYRAMYDAVVE